MSLVTHSAALPFSLSLSLAASLALSRSLAPTASARYSGRPSLCLLIDCLLRRPQKPPLFQTVRVRACVCACVRVYVRARVCVCVCVCKRVTLGCITVAAEGRLLQ